MSLGERSLSGVQFRKVRSVTVSQPVLMGLVSILTSLLQGFPDFFCG